MRCLLYTLGMRWALLLLAVFAPCLAAHPLDDQAQMLSEVVIVDNRSLELVLDFRYLSVLASYSEFSGTADKPGLDADGNGEVTREELKRRFNLLVDEFAFSFGISVDGQPVALKAEFDRFRFRDMENSGEVTFDTPYPIHSTRIHYRFVFTWTGPQTLAPGAHRVEYYFSGYQTVVHTPSEQMIAFDARVQPRKRLTNTSYDVAMEVFPKLIFNWNVEGKQSPETPVVVEPKPEPPPIEEAPRPEGIAELPAWLTLVAGVVMALVGLGSAARRAFLPTEGKRTFKPFLTALLFVFAGAAIVLGALVRLGYVAGM